MGVRKRPKKEWDRKSFERCKNYSAPGASWKANPEFDKAHAEHVSIKSVAEDVVIELVDNVCSTIVSDSFSASKRKIEVDEAIHNSK